MKIKKFTAVCLAALMVLTVVGVAGCSTSTPKATTSAATGKLVGSPGETYYCMAFLSGIDYWKGVFKGFQDAGNLFGVKTIYTGQTDASVSGEVTVFQQVVAKKPAGIAISTLNADAFVTPINDAIASGVQVITFDSDSPDSNRISYLSTGNQNAGKLAADEMINLLPDGGNIALLYSVGQQNVEERVIGFTNELTAKKSTITVKIKVNDKGDQTAATQGLEAALVADPSIKGVFCIDGVAGMAGATAIKETGKTTIKTIGFDTDTALLDQIKAGTISATLAQGTYNMGFWSMNFLFDTVHKLPAKPVPTSVDTGITIVTKDNVDQYYAK